MSRPKIGSVLRPVPSGEKGTRWIHSSSVDQAPDTLPAMPSAMNTATMAMPQTANGTRSGTSSPSNRPPATSSREMRTPGPHGLPGPVMRAVMSAWRWASARRPTVSRIRPGRSGSGGGARRPASHRFRNSAMSATTSAPTNSPSWAPRRVQKTES